MNLADNFLETLAAQGDARAITEPDGATISYAELHRQIGALAADLRARGLQPGEAAVIQLPNGIAFAVAVVAVLAAGGVAVLCEPGLGDDVYRARLRAAGARWVLVHPLIQWVNRIPGARMLLQRREVLVPPLLSRAEAGHHLTLSNRRLAQLPSSDEAAHAPCPREPGDDAIIIFTGGITSMPKGVRLSHGALRHYLGNIQGIANALGISRFLADTPQQVLYALSLGKEVLVTKGRTQRRARFVLQAIRDGRIDAYFGSPFLWVEMMAQDSPHTGHLPPSLRAVLLGGAPVTPEFLRRLRQWLHPNTEVRCLYGLTEAGPVCVATDAEKLAWDQGGDCVGRPLDGVRIQIEAMDGAIGEVLVASDALYSGYIGQAPRPEGEPMRTGDLGRLVEGGDGEMLVLMGRKKDMIIRNGVNIYPPSFEPQLIALRDAQGQPVFRECALVGLWHPERQDEAVVLCYTRTPDVPWGPAEVQRAVEPITGPDAAPDFYLPLDHMPVTGRQNKLDKQQLRRLAASAFHLAAEPPEHATP